MDLDVIRLMIKSDCVVCRGVATGEGIYTPKNSNRFVHVWDINICFEIAMTS